MSSKGKQPVVDTNTISEFSSNFEPYNTIVIDQSLLGDDYYLNIRDKGDGVEMCFAFKNADELVKALDKLTNDVKKHVMSQLIKQRD